MSKRSDTVGKLECINKFSVVVSYQSEKKNFYISPCRPFGWKIWIVNYPLHKVI